MPTIFKLRPHSTRGDDFLLRLLRERLDERVLLVQNASSITTSYNDIAVMDDVPAYLTRIHKELPDNGCFMAAFYGGTTLQELRTSLLAAEAEITGTAARRVAPMLSVGTAASLMQRAGFDLPVIDNEETALTYENADALVKDLRGSNLSNILAERHPLRRGVWDVVRDHYARNFPDPRGRIIATFDIIFLSGWKNGRHHP